MSDTFPPQGQMVLYSAAVPPLEDGSYQLTVETDVSFNPSDQTTDAPPGPLSRQHYFDIVGPRFAVPQSMVAGCFPPRNGHGAFQNDLPHIVLARRTLPWERQLAPSDQIPAVPLAPGDAPAISDPYPWVALLVFAEGEYSLLRNIPLEQTVPPSVFSALGSPANIQCDALEADLDLLTAILPTYEELRLLVHVRQVNTDDRELNAYGGDGFFSVAVANRLPQANAQCRAVLVSLEQRLDIIPKDRYDGILIQLPPHDAGTAAHRPIAVAGVAAATSGAAGPYTLSHAPVHTIDSGAWKRIGFPQPQKARLVALTSWQFTCEGPGTFEELMQNLDVAMFGVAGADGKPSLTDTGHLPVAMQDRAGASEGVLYRGPLVPYPLTRDAKGPYHCADQARRVTPESGAEDISYAAAFEAGRLLAAADPRMAKALLRWRRESFKQSARASTIAAADARAALNLPATLAETLHTPIAPRAAVTASSLVAGAKLPLGDPYGLAITAGAAGLDPAQLAAAWNLPSAEVASAILGGDPGTLGNAVSVPPTTARTDTNLGAVATDAAGLARLSAAREQVITNAKVFLGES